MKKPDPSLLALYHIGVIGGIEIDYRHMHTPRGGTYVRLRGNLGSIDGRWEDYREYLDLRVKWNSVAEIKAKFAAEIEAWWIFTESRRKELVEYERLKKIFEEG